MFINFNYILNEILQIIYSVNFFELLCDEETEVFAVLTIERMLISLAQLQINKYVTQDECNSVGRMVGGAQLLENSNQK